MEEGEARAAPAAVVTAVVTRPEPSAAAPPAAAGPGVPVVVRAVVATPAPVLAPPTAPPPQRVVAVVSSAAAAPPPPAPTPSLPPPPPSAPPLAPPPIAPPPLAPLPPAPPPPVPPPQLQQQLLQQLPPLRDNPTFAAPAAEAPTREDEVHLDVSAEAAGPDTAAPARVDDVERGDEDEAEEAQRLGASSSFFCPIGMEVMRDPVLVPTGITFERRNISQWLARGGKRCPVTGVDLPLGPSTPLLPNVALRQSIEEWAAAKMPSLLAAPHELPVAANEPSSPSHTLRPLEAVEASNLPATQPPPPPGDPGLEDLSLAEAIRLQAEEDSRARRQLEDRRAAQLQPAYRYPFTLAALVATLLAQVFPLTCPGHKIENIGGNPFLGSTAKDFVECIGAAHRREVVIEGEYFRVLSSLAMHAGVVHFASTLPQLWAATRAFEHAYGTARTAFVYVCGGALGVLTGIIAAPQEPIVGAPAGLGSLLGAGAAVLVLHWHERSGRAATFKALIASFAFNLALAAMPFVEPYSLVGGTLGGALVACTVLLLPKDHGARCDPFVYLQLGWGAVLIAVYLMFLGILAYERDADVRQWFGCDPVSGCSTCVDIGWWDCGAAKVVER